ncbi:hypothetical protein [Nocardioides sp.]|uniref:hypothetical protein n=1 Tax=Nocardioides sp. TaxID=35761 RepID=UPI0027246E23|nr:hypothetical protein [Nocardioides sp.]MDO9455238.1 hypothetical protein [Nocardioides sp.]
MGTDAWRNWQSFDEGLPELEYFIDELHSDCAFVGGPTALGPYELSLVHHSEPAGSPRRVRLVLLLKGGIHANLIPDLVVDNKLAPADSSAYYGGTISDELAALIALRHGVRLRVAGTRTLSGFHDDQETASPPINFEVRTLTTPTSAHSALQLPEVASRRGNLDDLGLIAQLNALSEASEIALIRAARAYAAGIWVAEEDANWAWLQLVTAVEVAATHAITTSAPPVDLLREFWPDMWAAVEPASPEVQESVAALLAEQMRATARFVNFIAQFAPDPPATRPEFSLFDWTTLRKASSIIYGHRSTALHAGKPFPVPMLEAPRREGEAFQEKPYGTGASGLGGIWHAKEAPMLLSTFEYIVRGALLNWWATLD